MVVDQLSLARKMQSYVRRAAVRAEQPNGEDAVVASTMVADQLAHQVLAREARLRLRHALLNVRRDLDQPIAGGTAFEGILEHLREGIPNVLSGVVLNHLQRGFDIVRMCIGGVVRDRAAVGTNGQFGARFMLHPCS